MVTGWPLIGRDEELDLLVTRMADGIGGGFVIGGAAGVGKSRLAREVAAQLAVKGWAVERVGATRASADIPFGALARLLPETPGTATETVRATVASLARRAGAQPLLVVVDDAHHLDSFSALLVHQLATDGHVRQLLTLRSGEAVPDALPPLWKDGFVDRIDLQPLARHEAATLLECVLGGPVERASVDALWRATEGTPLLLHEVVLDARATQGLRSEHGLWRWTPGRFHSSRLREVIGARMGELSREERGAVEFVALGEPLGLGIVESLAPGVDVTDLEQRAVLRIERDGLREDIRLWHPILADVIRGEMTGASRRLRAAQLADTLRDRGGRRRGDLLRLALLQLEGGDVAEPAELARAAMVANSLPDHALAERLAAAAHRVKPTWESALALGEAAVLQGKPGVAEAPLQEALDLAVDDATRARVAWDLHQLRMDQGRKGEAFAALDGATARIEDAAWLQVIEGHRVQALLLDGRMDDAAREGEALLARAVDGKVRLRLVTSLVPARALSGRTADALELASSVVPEAFAHQHELPLGITWVFVARAIALLLAGDLAAATTHVGMARATADGLVQTDAFAVLGLFEGRLALTCGRVHDAVRALRETASRMRTLDLSGYLSWTLALLAEAESLAGEQPRAERAAAECRSLAGDPGLWGTDAQRALAWVAAMGGARSRAVADLRQVAGDQASRGLRSLELQTRHDSYRLGDRTQAEPILALVGPAATVDGTWAETIRSHVLAAEAVDLDGLERAAAGFAAQGALLLAAEVEAEAAAVAASAGLRVREAGARRRCVELQARCGEGVRTPVLLDTEAPVELTPREREVVEMAARGLSNADIAQQLFVSVRTAEGHLARAFAKLGVSDRGALRQIRRPLRT